MKPLLVSSGEPAGIGPDLCLELAGYDYPLVVLGDQRVLESRAKELQRNVRFIEYHKDIAVIPKEGYLTILPISCPVPVISGHLNPQNASYVMELLTEAAKRCAEGEFSALVTAPVHKANINQAGISFTGHTEFFAHYYHVETVVMMLACQQMRVALATTHLPLRSVPDALSIKLICDVIGQLHHSLVSDFGIEAPCIKVAGLNPHAGESGYLGWEESDIIVPALHCLQEQGIQALGPFSADTLFNKEERGSCDAYVAMYHDQGLPVLKYAGFNEAVNITLGLPIIRTSVDHGTALGLAGKNVLNPGSMLAAVAMAIAMATTRSQACQKSVSLPPLMKQVD